ncbi:MAG TPA: M2 family metallopeptidase, partial [Bacteroidales bacterium]|nr:M2 family metallopeptidase [Bacteroidales bacterium]
MKKNLVKICSVSLSVILLMFLFTMCKGDKNKKEDMNKVFKEFVANLEAKVIPLHKESALAYFNAAISGKEEDFAKSAEFEIQMSKIFANKEDFATLKKIKESGQVTDELLARQLDVLYNAYLGNQIDEKKLEEMIQLQTEIEKKYNNFRAIVGKDSLTDNQIEEVLSTSTDTRKLKDVWMAHKKIGSLVADDIKKLVKMRNEAAVSLGFKNYHEMSLKLSEQDPTEIEKLFDELDNLTANVFVQLKSEIDEYLAKRYKIKKEELMPWHYQNRFFQEAPKIYTLDLDKYYKNKDVVELTKNYYASIGLPIDDMLAKSDLFEKPGKNQHAFCIDIDKQGDVRVLCNIKNNSMWMNTMLHEFGHAIYDKHIDINLPFFLRDPAHTFTTEAIAMMFGRMYSNPPWIKDNV